MDPVTIGLALAGAKKLVESAVDLKDAMHGIDHLLSAQEAKPPKKKKPKTRMQQVLRMRSGDQDYDDETSISSVANDVLEAKQQEAALWSLQQEINRKWGDGTWESIIAERAKRIAAKEAKKKKAKEADEAFWDKATRIAVEALKMIAVLAAAAGGAIAIWMNRCTGGDC
tara:strand:+ start:485 stop:994 length:510 start_codon:yes stop_codon:yes gene_type:complete